MPLLAMEVPVGKASSSSRRDCNVVSNYNIQETSAQLSNSAIAGYTHIDTLRSSIEKSTSPFNQGSISIQVLIQDALTESISGYQ